MIQLSGEGLVKQKPLLVKTQLIQYFIHSPLLAQQLQGSSRDYAEQEFLLNEIRQ
jgi:hypothetical protein